MFVFHTILAQTEASSAAGNSFILLGFVFVMVVLALLAAVTALIGAFFSRQAARETRKAAELALEAAEMVKQAEVTKPKLSNAEKPSEIQATEHTPEHDPALLAVIAAAIHSVIGERPHRIISIRPGGPGWAQEGRRQIFSSHQTR